MDFASIEQDNECEMQKGIMSLIAFAAQSHVLLIPVYPDPISVQAFASAQHPSDLLDYGERAWCRLEAYGKSSLTFNSPRSK